MNSTQSKSSNAQKAIFLTQWIQGKLVNSLENLDAQIESFNPIHWLRDEGIHGGGTRYISEENDLFDRASINFSHVHYDDEPNKNLASATALSAIIHPNNPNPPSIHMHFSWTEMRNGSGYWRMMADLNPSISNNSYKEIFEKGLTLSTGEHYNTGRKQGDSYFYIPALNKRRGISHFYLEGFDSGNFNADYEMTKKVASTVISDYEKILRLAVLEFPHYNLDEKQIQIDYHTLYMYQVLTLDKGTIAGILVHNQNDLGIFGSLPSTINGILFHEWIEKTPPPFDELVRVISSIIGKSKSFKIRDSEKLLFAEAIRFFYKQHPQLINFRNNVSHK